MSNSKRNKQTVVSDSKRNKLTILLNDAKIMKREGVAIPPHLLDEIENDIRNYAVGQLSEIGKMLAALEGLRDVQ